MKKLFIAVTSLLCAFSLASCNNDQGGEQEKPREVKTYIDWTFDDLEDGIDVPNTGTEGLGFKVVKEGNNGYITSKDTQNFSAIYFGVPGEDGNEIYLKDFAIETAFRLPEENDGIANDGGLALFVGSDGRYDAAIGYPENIEDNAFVNVWKAGNVDGGPMATNDKEQYPDRGYVSDFKLKYDEWNTYTILGKSEEDADGNRFVNLYVYVNNVLVVNHKIPSWDGGFGVRAFQSAMQYDYIKVTDLPLVSPDGAVEFK